MTGRWCHPRSCRASPHVSSAGGAGNEGSGLGLAIVAAIAERLGSTLTLRSPATGRDQGFEVEIGLPVDAGLAADQTEPHRPGA